MSQAWRGASLCPLTPSAAAPHAPAPGLDPRPCIHGELEAVSAPEATHIWLFTPAAAHAHPRPRDPTRTPSPLSVARAAAEGGSVLCRPHASAVGHVPWPLAARHVRYSTAACMAPHARILAPARRRRLASGAGRDARTARSDAAPRRRRHSPPLTWQREAERPLPESRLPEVLSAVTVGGCTVGGVDHSVGHGVVDRLAGPSSALIGPHRPSSALISHSRAHSHTRRPASRRWALECSACASPL